NLKFDELKQRISDKDYNLGECFSKYITFVKYKDNEFHWKSTAKDKDKKMITTNWGLITYFVRDTFTEETKIINIPIVEKDIIQEKPIIIKPMGSPIVEESISFDDIQMQFNSANEDTDNLNYSTTEDFEMKSSCIAPSASNTELAKEKKATDILDEPMVKKVKSLFDPKKVRVIKKI
nr:DNA polymerase III subunit gamma/tau [Sulfurovaceae bacterium]